MTYGGDSFKGPVELVYVGQHLLEALTILSVQTNRMCVLQEVLAHTYHSYLADKCLALLREVRLLGAASYPEACCGRRALIC